MRQHVLPSSLLHFGLTTYLSRDNKKLLSHTHTKLEGRNLILTFFVSTTLFLKHSNKICIKSKGMDCKLYLRKLVQSRFTCVTATQVKGEKVFSVSLSTSTSILLTIAGCLITINYCLLLLNIKGIGLCTMCSFVPGFCHSVWLRRAVSGDCCIHSSHIFTPGSNHFFLPGSCLELLCHYGALLYLQRVPNGKKALISPLWVAPPWAGSPALHKKAGRASHGEYASKKHFSMASESFLSSGFLP